MITFTGDLYLGSKSITIDKEVLNELNQSSFVFSNFENIFDIENAQKRKDKNAILVTNEKRFEDYISKFNTKHIFGLGNNHVHDLNEKGIDYLKNKISKYPDIQYTGVGYYNEVQKPLIIEDGLYKIALLTVSTDEPEVMSILTSEKKKGVLDYNDCKVLEIIKEYNKKVDYFVILPHWGEEYLEYPSVQTRNRAYRWINAGADLVIGHHPHIIQGKELYRGKYIYYSLGNYIFPNFKNKNGVRKTWSKEHCFSYIVKINFGENLSTNEFGLFFDVHSNRLMASEESIKILHKSSVFLDAEKYSVKDYFSKFDNERYKKYKKKHSFINKIIRKVYNKLYMIMSD